jgi:DNA segregation ATPase FtsK/SpoIIIE, S-DNA-T family
MQTVNNAIDPRAVGEMLDRLKAGVAAVTAGEAALLKSKAERYSSLRREAMRHAEVETAKLETRIHELNAGFQQSLARHEAAVEARGSRIQQAYHASKSNLARRVQRTKDLKIGHVQGEIMRKRQQRQAELEQAVSARRAFRDQLAADRELRRSLRDSVLSSLRSFRLVIAGMFLGKPANPVEMEESGSAEEIRQWMLGEIENARAAVAEAARLPLPWFFRVIPLCLLMSVVLAAHVWYGLRAGGGGLRLVLPSLLIAEGAMLIFWSVALASAWPVIRRASGSLERARLLEIGAEKSSAVRVAVLDEEIKNTKNEEGRNLSETFRQSDDEWRAAMAAGQRELDERMARMPARLDRMRRRGFEKNTSAHESAISAARQVSETRNSGFERVQNTVKSAIDAETHGNLDSLNLSWQDSVLPTHSGLAALNPLSSAAFPPWSSAACQSWEPPTEAPAAIRIGSVAVDVPALCGGLPSDPRFGAAGISDLTVPLALAFPDQASIMIESDGSDDAASTRALGTISLRILASLPPGRAKFVFIDPVGLGREFAGLMHLADYEETLIHHRIWTQNTHIEERLAELNDHIEKVIQMYLRDEFPNITEYNRHAGTIAEKYRFLVVSGFPSGFSDTASKRLLSIASSGARCGVHLLLQRDLRQPVSNPALEQELRRACLCVISNKDSFRIAGTPAGADAVAFDPPPAHQDSITLVHRIGRASIDSNRVQVPFGQVAPSDAEVWSLDTSEELRVPIGRTGAKKLQMLAIGKGTRQHMLVAGKTGSGKSTLFHVIITNLAMWSSPDQVEFYLVDFKKGVEFKCYASKKLPHARVVAIESDREFALSVLQRVDAELKRRGELFRQANTQDLSGYRRTRDVGPMPRTLLLIDEFQEFFTEDDAVAQEASLLLDRIVRQGRAFGIHVILGSQTLGGAYTLARATLGQMVIRVALQCNETDAHLIMDDDNPAPRLLTRPGEGIYNDQAGALAANSPFQIVWLPEGERDAVLDRVHEMAASAPGSLAPPIVFEGNAPADIHENVELAKLLLERPARRPAKSRAWLGAPNSIKGPTEAVFQRQSGSHLLAVGQSSERSLALLTLSLVALAAQYPPDQAAFVILDPHAAEEGGDDFFRRLDEIVPHPIRIAGPADLTDVFRDLGRDLTERAPTSGRDAPEVFVLIHGLHRFKSLRPEDDFRFSMDDDAGAVSPSKALADLLGEGGPCGMHAIATTDTWNNVSRWIPRKLMAEFEMRVLFQMSANDSANLIDSPAASMLGLHRALFFNEHLGTLETFRPYSVPGREWLEEISGSIGTWRA